MNRNVAPRTFDAGRDHLVALLEDPWYARVARVQAELATIAHQFFQDEGCRPALMPVTTGSVSSPMGLGSDSRPVSTALHGREIFLADSMQFQLELAVRWYPSGAYYLMPSFRGEDADESHLNEFFHVEVEILGGFEAILDLAERFLVQIARRLAGNPDVPDHRVSSVSQVAARSSFPRITHEEAVAAAGLVADGVTTTATGHRTLTRLGEQHLIEVFGGGAPVWVTHPPNQIVPFYQAVDGQGRARAADLLLGVGEILGCGERHASRQATVAALEDHRVDPATYDWYLEMKERTPVTTSGFGLGLERLMMWILDHGDIRDLQLLPRQANRAWYV